MKPTKKLLYSMAFVLTVMSCDSFLEIDPPRNQLVTKSVFTEDKLADGAVAGIYQEWFSLHNTSFASGGSNSVTALLGIAADDLVFNPAGPITDAFMAGDWLTDNTGVYNLWASAYKSIFRANEVLEGLAASTTIGAEVASRIRGEVLFVRAFCYFYLVNLFGDVPLVTTADYRVTSVQPRDPLDMVYVGIEADLSEATGLLPTDYSHAQGERIRPNRWAAVALQARVALYQGKWEAAADYAGQVIGRTADYAVMDGTGGVFLKNSSEAIWQLLPVGSTTTNAYEGLLAIPLPTLQASPNYSVTPRLLDAFSDGDAREGSWLGDFTLQSTQETYRYPFKYKVRTSVSGSAIQEYSMILRLAEQYLIRAEARAQLGDLADALADLNVTRVRHGGLAPLAGLDKDEVLAAIEGERLVEFFYEWGHRWFDTKRWGRHSTLLPIPQREREANPALTQNDNY